MTNTNSLCQPLLTKQHEAGLSFLTDIELARTTGVHIAFVTRLGGVSTGTYSSLNLGAHVHDEVAHVQENRYKLLSAFAAQDAHLIVPKQIHGTNLVIVDEKMCANTACEQARAGADGLVVGAKNTAALLCFADCTPVIIVSPSKRFAVVHAGWRGAVAHIASKAVHELSCLDEQTYTPDSYNAYIGPCIHVECFECGKEVSECFAQEFGASVVLDGHHVDLSRAVALDLIRAGMSETRIYDAGICTACNEHEWFSYRASGGACGRHGAFAFLKER